MKKLLLLAAIVAIPFLQSCDKEDDKLIGVNDLPAKAQELISTYFAGIEISYAKVDKDLFEKTYEVLFADGSKVEFEKDGDWKEVSCRYTKVPDGIIPQPITDYVSTNHSSLYAVEIDRDKHGYEVKMNNGMELKFNKDYGFIGFDS